MNRSCVLVSKGLFFIFCLCMARPTAALAIDSAFGFEDVAAKAKALAQNDFKPPAETVPDFLKKISYDQFRDIRFKDSATLWGQEATPFKIRFFHLGFYYKWPVAINYVDAGQVHAVAFSPGLFDYGKNTFGPQVPPNLGFAGFRIHYPINRPDYEDEVAVFLGATYFRAVAKHQVYGLSARGLAIDTASAKGEEFPFFKEFWIVKPGPQDSKITVYALMDSVSVAGAYQFVIQPGHETVMAVKSTLFTRKKIDKLEIAPMTSMFLYGKNSTDLSLRDYRPEVHDSDGLMIATKWGEWIWRPLIDPKTLQVNTFEVGTPKGFGLFQRDLNFDHYQDLESNFERRPSLWMEPQRDWGQGHVELVEIPSDSEHNDNINAYWVPGQSIEAHQTLEFAYTLEWCSAMDKGSYLSRVSATRVALSTDHQKAKFVLDFEGLALNSLPPDQNPQEEIHVNKGYSIVEQQLYKNPVTGGWRLVFELQEENSVKNTLPEKRPGADLRVWLKAGDKTLSETWTYTYFF